MKYKLIKLSSGAILSFTNKIIFDIDLPLIETPEYFLTSNSNNCWKWNAVKDKDGYGIFRRYRAHRVAYYFKNNNISETLLIGHICNNPSCVNPNHLIQITNNENMNYMVECNRSAAGEKHGRSSLLNNEIENIIIDIFNNKSKLYILLNYKISESQLFHLLNGDSWKNQTFDFCQSHNIVLKDLKLKVFGTYSYNINNKNAKSDLVIYQLLEDIHLNRIICKSDIIQKYNISRSTINQILNGNSRASISKKFEFDYNIKLNQLKTKIFKTS